MFTYQLCYLYGKSLKSTSIPIPIKYSHLACYRARSHLTSYLNETKTNKKSSIDSLEADLLDQTTTSFTKSTNLFDQPRTSVSSFQAPSISYKSILEQKPSTSSYQQWPSTSYASFQPTTFGLPYPNRPPPPLNQPPIFSLSNPLSFDSNESSLLNQSNLFTKTELTKSKRRKRGKGKNKDDKKDINKESIEEIDINLQSKVQVKENLRMTFYFL